jgi:N-acyl-D-aspartate/D-glutamate deacylase
MIVTVKEAIETLPVKLQKDSNVIQLSNILVSIVSDQDLKKQVTILTEKIEIFDQLREAMQIALPNGKNGLNDDGKEEDVKTIKEKVTAFRNSAEVEEAAKKNIDYTKMLKQIDKYWDKLFADPITVFNSKGEKIIIQPQRTNNILERLFRSIKRGFRKKSGNKSLNRTFKSLIANTPLVENLKNSEYMKVLLDKHNSLEDLFADINVKDVRKELEKINNMDEKASMKINKILSDSNLPLKIAKATKKEAGY